MSKDFSVHTASNIFSKTDQSALINVWSHYLQRLNSLSATLEVVPSLEPLKLCQDLPVQLPTKSAVKVEGVVVVLAWIL